MLEGISNFWHFSDKTSFEVQENTLGDFCWESDRQKIN